MRKIKTNGGIPPFRPILRTLFLTLFLLSFFGQQNLLAQAPISTQAEIDNLVADCACTEFPGDLIIIGVGDITDLTPLSPLTSVGGIFGISFFPTPINLDGIQNITSVGGNFLVASTTGYTDLTAFSNLSSVNGDLIISSNTTLETLEGLNSLTSIGGSLSIQDNSSLTNINALENVTSIGVDPINNVSIEISDNISLSDCCGIQDIIASPGAFTGDVFLSNNQTGCQTETEIADANCAPDPDDDMDGVTVGGGDCDDNDPNNFPGNTEVCDGQDNNCDGETDEGLSGLTFPGNIVFTSQSELDAWPSCYTAIEGDLGFSGGDIVDLSPIANITTVGDVFSMVLTNVDVVPPLSLTDIGGSMILQRNHNLEDFSGLSNLVSVGSDPGQAHINLIDSNDGLLSLNGLQNVISAGIDPALIVRDNALLSDCCALTNLLENNTFPTLGIFNNSTGCDSEAEVEADCTVDPDGRRQ